jgi:hypothetical protein
MALKHLPTLLKRRYEKRTFWTTPKKEHLNISLFQGIYNILDIKSVYFLLIESVIEIFNIS